MLALPVNVKDIISGHTVEWERVEFRKGWNPERCLHTICAFANDFHNFGGGYVILGIEENDGRPVLPPCGLKVSEIDGIQKDILNLGHKINPGYTPIVVPEMFMGKHVLVIWAYGGQTRPYKAPVSLGKDNREYAYYIRKGSSSVRANHQEEKELIGLSATVPFDDRINHQASLEDIDLGLVRTHLQRVKSKLFETAAKMDFKQLCRQMNIAGGPDEMIRPKNVALMFFNSNPDKFFPYTQIDVVHFPDGPGADSFTEKIFKGPLSTMIQEALSYIKGSFIVEKVIKHPDRPEATRCFNYPYSAIEEAICNAVYHRSYEIREPIECRILPDKLMINSLPGPDRSISDEDIKKYTLIPKRYRNRRIGEFLKELELAEGRGTGIPKILKEVRNNGSPKPKLIYDEDRSYFTIEFPIHKAFGGIRKVKGQSESIRQVIPTEKHDGVHDGVHDINLNQTEQDLLSCLKAPKTTPKILLKLGYPRRTRNYESAKNRLLALKLIEMTIPDKPRSKNQEYRLTSKGQALLASLRSK